MSKKQPGCIAWILWLCPVVLFSAWMFEYGYNDVKNKDWVGKPADPAAVTTHVGAPRTLHEMPGAPPGERIPYPFDPVWQNTIAPVMNGICAMFLPLILLILWWLCKASYNVRRQERTADGGRYYQPWTRPD